MLMKEARDDMMMTIFGTKNRFCIPGGIALLNLSCDEIQSASTQLKTVVTRVQWIKCP
jgi:hypothetical protein